MKIKNMLILLLIGPTMILSACEPAEGNTTQGPLANNVIESIEPPSDASVEDQNSKIGTPEEVKKPEPKETEEPEAKKTKKSEVKETETPEPKETKKLEPKKVDFRTYCKSATSTYTINSADMKNFFTAVNKERSKLGYGSLSWDSSLASAAQKWSESL